MVFPGVQVIFLEEGDVAVDQFIHSWFTMVLLPAQNPLYTWRLVNFHVGNFVYRSLVENCS